MVHKKFGYGKVKLHPIILDRIRLLVRTPKLNCSLVKSAIDFTGWTS